MTDRGRPIEFGFFLIPEAADPARPLTEARRAEAAGLDLVGIQDHPYNPSLLDAFTLIPLLAAQTERIRFFSGVANLPLRMPALLAKAAATLDRLVPGRFHLGLGAGAYWDGIASIGGVRRSRGDAVDALSEAVDAIRLLWSSAPTVDYAGRHYRLDGVTPGPAPEHDIEIWLGAYGARMLDLVGSKADGWIPSSPYAGPTNVRSMAARIDDAAVAAGRDPASIRRVYNVFGRISDDPGDEPFIGPAARWVDELAGLALDGGFDTFLLWPSDGPIAAIDRFVAEVIPEVRSLVVKERSALRP